MEVDADCMQEIVHDIVSSACSEGSSLQPNHGTQVDFVQESSNTHGMEPALECNGNGESAMHDENCNENCEAAQPHSPSAMDTNGDEDGAEGRSADEDSDVGSEDDGYATGSEKEEDTNMNETEDFGDGHTNSWKADFVAQPKLNVWEGEEALQRAQQRAREILGAGAPEALKVSD
eukprot:CAMPEP_0181331086 /NCGR_PEP_ID=MMETSP1101-20121128/24292_1 /TAXON_ID=46948 /ORGANISM="Rhodomonas abbreviata, Strain Caron Lab Isolate" /LENGTH=175 /DNA_ID=CAMNT_0023440479 /DNA_START=500 /DNA_END=1024 /DNA_ORIENTATION=-